MGKKGNASAPAVVIERGASTTTMRRRLGLRKQGPCRPVLAGIAALALAAQIGIAAAGGGSEDGEAPEVRTAPTRTIKERLSNKASDEQRLDNCKVPLELRGAKPRPDDCRHGASPAPTQ